MIEPDGVSVVSSSDRGRPEAEGWRLKVEQADIMADFLALNDLVWGGVFKLDGTMTEAHIKDSVVRIGTAFIPQ